MVWSWCVVGKSCYSMSTIVTGETVKRTIWDCAGADDVITVTEWNGEAGYRSQYLSHAKRALYHLSYIPFTTHTLPHKNTKTQTTHDKQYLSKHSHTIITYPSINLTIQQPIRTTSALDSVVARCVRHLSLPFVYVIAV